MRRVWLGPVLLSLLRAASAQNPNGPTASSLVVEHGSNTAQAATATRFVTVQVFTSTLGLTSSSSPTASTTASMASTSATVANATVEGAAASALAAPINLDTRIDPAFGILGAILILSGLALAITGSAHKRLAVSLATVYAFAIVTMALILHFGVEEQISQPSIGVRVGFVMASLAAGCIVGVAAVVFHREAKAVIAPIAGFIFGLLIQSLRSNGLIARIGFRYFLYLGCTGIAFITGLIPFMQDFVFLVSTALLGAIAFTIGIDCYTTANLKEFFVYNLGFSAIFPKLQGHFPITSAMQVELGVLLLVFFISVAAQIRLYNMFETKLAVILKRAKKEADASEEDRAASRIAGVMEKDIEKFEHRYSKAFPFATPPIEHSSQFAHIGGSPRTESAPLLPELAYTSERPKSARIEAASQRFSAVVRSFTVGQDRQRLLSDSGDLPRETASMEMSAQPSEGLLADILDKEKALEEIAKLRERIGAERSSLRPSTAGSANTSANSISFPVAVHKSPVQSAPMPHARSQSLTLDAYKAAPTPVKRASAVSVPRPISQYSIVPVQAPISPRPAMTAPTSLPMLQFDTPAAEPTAGLNYHARNRSHGTLLGRSPSNNTISGMGRPGPQRVITGSMPSRPSSTSLHHVVIPRTQTMDIQELEARHRRKLSQMQSGSRNSLVLAAGASLLPNPEGRNTATSSQPATAGEASRKRSSSIAGLNSVDGAQRHSHQSMVDEFGQLIEVSAYAGSRRTSRRASVAQRAPMATPPVLESATTTSKPRPNDWLSY